MAAAPTVKKVSDDDESPEAMERTIAEGLGPDTKGVVLEEPEGKELSSNRGFVDESGSFPRDDEATEKLTLEEALKGATGKLGLKVEDLLSAAVRVSGDDKRILVVTKNGRKYARRA